MLSGLKYRLGIVEVELTPKYLQIEGISTLALFKDMYRVWGSNTVSKHMFAAVRGNSIKMLHFFAMDFLYICETLYEDKLSRTPKRVLAKLIEQLLAKTWLGQVDRQVESITDDSDIANLVPFALKPYQGEFVRLFGRVVPAYHLRGYMLDAAPGSGKTIADLLVAYATGANKVFVVVPKNSAQNVWEDTIAHVLLQKKKYWISTSNEQPTLDVHYYICHYESLEVLVNFAKTHLAHLKKSFIILDESHHFNRLAADRTQLFVELCLLPGIGPNLWASGTPILALGSECIPFLKCVAPDFTPEAEEAFRKIYGRDAKRANDILRHRIGHLKFHVPSSEVVDIKVNVQQVMVQMPNAQDYTLEAIGKVMRTFIAERQLFYAKNKKYFEDKYQEGLSEFEKTLDTDIARRSYGHYRAAFRTVASGYDPRLMKHEAQLCNTYEMKTIYPLLPPTLKAAWKNSRSVVKYPKLKILGEALGSVVGGMRSKCHLEMIKHIDFVKVIDGARKKTLIFTSFVEVLQATTARLVADGYKPAEVYGATNKDVNTIISTFHKDEDLNPLSATFQSLSTAVPVTAASDLMLINQPFRAATRTQTIARAARLGQDGEVNVWDYLLDTGDAPNISTRSNDIMKWSEESAASILGIATVDDDTLALESKDYFPETTDMEEESVESMTPLNLPPYLYHGSAYKQEELMPGFQRSGNKVEWDKTETNEWLYTADSKTEAIMLGIGSAIEKKYLLDRYHYDERRKTLTVELSELFTKHDLFKLTVWIYTIRAEAEDGWTANYNTINGMTGEYKTQRTVEDNILKCELVDVAKVLHSTTLQITCKTPTPTE